MSLRQTMMRNVCLIGMMGTLAYGASGAGSRRLHPGDPVPAFSVMDLTGQTYTYDREAQRALMVVVLSAEQDYSLKAQADLETILGSLGRAAADLDLVVSTDDPNAFRNLIAGDKPFAGRMIMTLDSDYRLWGKFGIIAVPTVVICSPDSKVLWVEAGYGYDFAPVVRARLNQALGIAQATSPDAAGVVSTVVNDTVEAKVKRLLQAAELMSSRGDTEAAITEAQRAHQLDANSPEVRIRLGELLCKNGQGREALALLDGTTVPNRAVQARIRLVQGWAHRQAGHLDRAEKMLLEALELDRSSARAYFELGRVYEAQQATDEALEAYRQALRLVFGQETNPIPNTDNGD